MNSREIENMVNIMALQKLNNSRTSNHLDLNDGSLA